MSAFVVVENVDRPGERDVVWAPTYGRAFDEMRRRYHPDELEEMNVRIAVETEEGRDFDLH